jgi:chromosome segregation ATPase
LQAQLVELQIDTDALRTDRDSLLVELRGARDHLQLLETDQHALSAQAQQREKALQATERALQESRGLCRRHEEALEKVMVELREEQRERVSAEQAYHARTNDFISRFDNLKRYSPLSVFLSYSLWMCVFSKHCFLY